jgi:hypothetical protein
MDGRGFDSLTRRFATGLTRRSVVRGIVGAGAAVAATRMVVPAGAAPQKKVDICHYDADTGLYHRINVNGNALDAHLAHGDVLPGQDIVLGSVILPSTNPNPVDTGIFVADGESVTVTITGLAGFCCDLLLDGNGSGACGGYGITLSCGSVASVVGGGNIFTDYTVFQQLGAGSNIVTASGTSGNLVLQFVDGCPECYDDNSGEFVATITRTC